MKKVYLITVCAIFTCCAKKEDMKSNITSDSISIEKTDAQNLKTDSVVVSEPLNIKKNEIAKIESSIAVSEISNLPSDIDGCGSYFSASKSKYNSSIFIYVDNMQNAYMNINGDLEMFDILNNNEKETTLSNEKYNIKISSKKVGDLDEGTLLKGNIEITSKINSEKKNIEFYGGAGC